MWQYDSHCFTSLTWWILFVWKWGRRVDLPFGATFIGKCSQLGRRHATLHHSTLARRAFVRNWQGVPLTLYHPYALRPKVMSLFGSKLDICGENLSVTWWKASSRFQHCPCQSPGSVGHFCTSPRQRIMHNPRSVLEDSVFERVRKLLLPGFHDAIWCV